MCTSIHFMTLNILDLLVFQVVQMHCNLESNEEGTKTHVSHIVPQELCVFYHKHF